MLPETEEIDGIETAQDLQSVLQYLKKELEQNRKLLNHLKSKELPTADDVQSAKHLLEAILLLEEAYKDVEKNSLDDFNQNIKLAEDHSNTPEAVNSILQDQDKRELNNDYILSENEKTWRVGDLCLINVDTAKIFEKRRYGIILRPLENELVTQTHVQGKSNITFLVALATPTTSKEIICRYVNSGVKCPYNAQCIFNHGFIKPPWELNEVSSSNDIKINSRVIAKYNKDLWHTGTVTGIHNTSYSIKSTETNQSGSFLFVSFDPPVQIENSVPTSHILPALSHAPGVQIEAEKDENYDSDVIADLSAEPQLYNVESFDASVNVIDFGQWMKYTSGFGLKFMQKHGYTIGDHLGSKERNKELGDALVEPIPIRIFPPGKGVGFISEAKQLVFKTKKKKKNVKSANYSKHDQMNRVTLFDNIMNSGILQGLSTAESEKKRDHEELKAEQLHHQNLSSLRKSKQSESDIRKEVLACQEMLKRSCSELKNLETNVKRHSTQNKKYVTEQDSNKLQFHYSNAFLSKKVETERLSEKLKVLQQKLKQQCLSQKMARF